ncbi:MAG: c-type cytochrome [Phycisphaeraceae bacterium]|nr:c-type cytochrome [Phycisphaeraceae bacterium]
MMAMLSVILGDAGPMQRLWFRDHGSSTYAAETDHMYMFLLWLSVACFVGLMAAMVYFVIKYRWRKGQPIIRSAGHNTPMEVTWTVLPTILLVVIFFKGFWVYAKQQVAPAGALQLTLTAKKWSWDIQYPNGSGSTETTKIGAVDIPVFIVPEDTPVEIRMTSEDVIHSFWVPDFRMKQDVFPNRFTKYWFQSVKLKATDNDNPALGYPNREHWLFCAEYCGDNHSEMAGLVRVVPREQFAAWMREPFPGAMPMVEVGKILYSTKGCNGCHTTNGDDNTGPTWKDLYGSTAEYQDGSSWVLDDNAIREAIYNPGAKVRIGRENRMPTYQGSINSKQLMAIIAFMKSISENAPASAGDELWGSLDAQGNPVEAPATGDAPDGGQTPEQTPQDQPADQPAGHPADGGGEG